MGFLEVGEPLDWPEALEHLNYVREHGVTQFINHYRSVRDISGDQLRWGDEIEYAVYKVDHENKRVRVSNRGAEILEVLRRNDERAQEQGVAEEACKWMPEWGAWMIEGTPAAAFSGYTFGLRSLEANMRLRRSRLLAALHPDEIAPTLTAFPMLGVDDFCHPPAQAGGPVGQSLFIPDECINPHPRFPTMVKCIRQRRGCKIDIRVPKFQDVHTPLPNPSPRIPVVPKTVQQANQQSHVYMDSMAFGMGCCCLQVTFQARDVSESRHLYDHLAVLAPVMLALTAATPIMRGHLVDVDARWSTVAASVDDRTRQEMGQTSGNDDPRMAGDGSRHIAKSRYDTIDMFMCNHDSGCDPHTSTAQYNDVEVPYDEKTYERLKEEGLDDLLAMHIAHLFIRDPLVIFRDRIELDDTTSVEHFENIQSTNWNSVRWKPPPPMPTEGAASRKIGWRTEFRPMEVQITDFENAAFAVFIVLVSRVILAFELNLYIPISKVDENMGRAHRRDAVLNEHFYFRRHMAPIQAGDCKHEGKCSVHNDHNSYEEMSVREIMTGKGSYFPGLVPLCYAYLDSIECDSDTRTVLTSYLEFIVQRSCGDIMTTAAWIRKFVRSHPDYKMDSVVPQSTAYDLMMECKQIGEGTKKCPELLGNVNIAPIRAQDAYHVHLKSHAMTSSTLSSIVKRYTQRAELATKRRKLSAEIQEKQQTVSSTLREIESLQNELNSLEEDTAH